MVRIVNGVIYYQSTSRGLSTVVKLLVFVLAFIVHS